MSAYGQRGLTGRPRSKARSTADQDQGQGWLARRGWCCRSCRRLRRRLPIRSLRQLLQRIADAVDSVGASLLAKAMVQTANILRHAHQRDRSAFRPPRALLIWLLILGAPLNHAGRNSILRRRVNRQGCRFSRAGPGMALRGGPPNQCRITGMPSLGEGPSGGARAFCLLLRCSKVRRRKGATLRGRYLANGYVHKIQIDTHTYRAQAPLPQKITSNRQTVKPPTTAPATCQSRRASAPRPRTPGPGPADTSSLRAGGCVW